MRGEERISIMSAGGKTSSFQTIPSQLTVGPEATIGPQVDAIWWTKNAPSFQKLYLSLREIEVSEMW